MRIAYFDCFSGASGDMVLGACIDAGAPLGELQGRLAGLSVGGYTLTATKVRKQGFAATQAEVAIAENVDTPHRHLRHVCDIIDRSNLHSSIKASAIRVFERLAEAEAAAHGTTPDRVHFHEVGAIDAIVDIVGACIALDLLGIDEVRCSPIPPGSGTVRCQHGLMPVPAPGTAALLKGVPLAACEEAGELTTPTGAAILTTLAAGFGVMPAMTIRAIGCGAGRREGQTRPNLLRLFVGEVSTCAEGDEIVVTEANLDDSTPEVIGYVLDRLLAAGALDAYCTPIYMKKGRPAVMISALTEPGQQRAVEAILFAETTTFGVRSYRAARRKLVRSSEEVETPYGRIRVKVGRHDGKIVTTSPEYEDCRAAAERTGAPLREVMAAAMRSFVPDA